MTQLERILLSPVLLMIVLLPVAQPAVAKEAPANDEIVARLEAQVREANARSLELQQLVQAMTAELETVKARMAAAASGTVPAKSGRPATAVAAGGERPPVTAEAGDGLTLGDGGNWALRVYGRMQADYRHFWPEAVGADTFSLRRARLGAFLTLYRDIVFRVEGEYASGTVALNDGYLDFNRWPGFMIRAGQFKPFYGLERAMGAFNLDYEERSLADNVLGPVFDRGVMIHGAPVEGVYYNLAVVNGAGPADEPVATDDGKDLSARLAVNLAPWMRLSDTVIHIGGFHARGDQGAGSAIPAPRTEANGVNFFATTSAATGRNTFAAAVDRARSGAEAAVALGSFKMQGEYLEADYDGPGYDRALQGYYLSLNWLATGERYAALYRNAAFGRFVPDRNLDTGGWGGLELGLRYSRFDADDFNTANADGSGRLAAGTSNGADAWTLAAKWMLNPYASLIFNYVHTGFDSEVAAGGTTVDHEDALALRAQFDF